MEKEKGILCNEVHPLNKYADINQLILLKKCLTLMSSYVAAN